MKTTVIDILKAVGLTLGGFLIAALIVEGLKWLANQASIDTIYIVALLLFSIVAYANYKLIKLSK